MSTSPIYPLFQFKRFLEGKGILVHWQYLILATVFSLLGGFIWAYASILYDMEFGFIAVLFGFMQGFLAFLYMRVKGDPRLIFYSLVLSMLSLFLGKYLLFVHYYDWVLSGVVDKGEISFSLLLFYFQVISFESISEFIVFYKDTFGFYDILWIVMIMATSMEYQFFYSFEDDDKGNNGPSQSKGRKIQRRFSGQQF